MRGTTLFLWFVACLSAQQASIEGTVVNKSTGEPLSGVHVRLLAISIEQQGASAAYGAMSDRNGHFSINPVKAGSYVLAPERTGFVHVPPKNDGSAIPGVTLKAGEHIADYKMEMTPRAVIRGRVVDDFGDPVRNIQLSLSPVDGAPAINMFGNGGTSTDDRGEFRLSTAPGKYYVRAAPNMFNSGPDGAEVRTDGSTEAVYNTTYYPNAAATTRASVVEVAAGAEVTGIEIRLGKQQSAGSISGMVTGAPEGLQRPSIVLQSGESAQRMMSSRSSSVGPDGRFSFGRLTAGFYRLTAVYSSGSVQLQSQAVDLKMEGGEQNVQLALAPGGEVTGTLKLDGAAPGGKRTVRLEGTGMTFYGQSQTGGGTVDADGNFRLQNVFPGKYRVKVDPLPDTGYVRQVDVAGVVTSDGMADLSRGGAGAHLKIEASVKGALFSGRVLSSSGEPVANTVAIVAILKNPDDMGEENMIRVKSDGTFEMKGIRPGKYHVFALDAFRFAGSDPNGNNPFKELFPRGEIVEFKEGDKIVKDLKALEKEESNAKPKQ